MLDSSLEQKISTWAEKEGCLAKKWISFESNCCIEHHLRNQNG
jgi:hypothetical protein